MGRRGDEIGLPELQNIRYFYTVLQEGTIGTILLALQSNVMEVEACCRCMQQSVQQPHVLHVGCHNSRVVQVTRETGVRTVRVGCRGFSGHGGYFGFTGRFLCWGRGWNRSSRMTNVGDGGTKEQCLQKKARVRSPS
jgi:hypothetical protein